MQSLDYPGYKDSTELDMLAHLLTREQIIDYHEVECFRSSASCYANHQT